eukprot:Rmarinus@m.25944
MPGSPPGYGSQDTSAVKKAKYEASHYSYCMVFPNEEDMEIPPKKKQWYKTERLRMINELKKKGVKIVKQKSRDGDELFAKLSLVDEQMEIIAEKIELRVAIRQTDKGRRVTYTERKPQEVDDETAPLNPYKRETELANIQGWWLSDAAPCPDEGFMTSGLSAGAGYVPFKRADKHLYKGFINGKFSFLSREKMIIVQHVVEGDEELGGAGINVGMAIKEGTLVQFFPMHGDGLDELIRAWSEKYDGLTNQPLDSIRDYYGEKIGLYFAFLGFYTHMLYGPAGFGFILYIGQVAAGDNDNVSVISLYCIFMSIWGILFLELWGRENIRIAYRWNVMDFEEEQRPRADFVGKDRINPITGMREKYYPEKKRYMKYLITYPIVVVLVMCVMCVMTATLYVKNENVFGLGWAAGIMNGVIITVFNMLFMGVAETLNDWENHRTDTDYEDALIAKAFIFQFVNSYFTLFMVAFAKPNAEALGLESVTGNCPCTDGSDDCDDEDRSCITEISDLLFVIFLIQVSIGNVQEVLIPLVMSRVNLWLEDMKMEAGADGEIKKISRAEYEAKLTPYDSPFDDYNELIIQFGYITFFAAAFPLVGLLALVNNLIEIRSDSTKLTKAFQRPHAAGAEDIGTWYTILTIMSFIAVTTNCGLVFFTSRFHDNFEDDWGPRAPIWGFFVAEHTLFGFKILISFMIPDVPEEIQALMDRDAWEEKKEKMGEMGEMEEFNVGPDEFREDSDDYPSEDEFGEMLDL